MVGALSAWAAAGVDQTIREFVAGKAAEAPRRDRGPADGTADAVYVSGGGSSVTPSPLEGAPGIDVYFRPEYLRLSELTGGGRATTLSLGAGSMRAICPLLVRRDEHVQDAFTPYGYGGLLWTGTPFHSVEASRYLFECLRRWCRNEGLSSCLLRLHPLLTRHFCLEGVADDETIVRQHGVTLGINLSEWNTNRDRLARLKKGRISDLAVAKRSLKVEILQGKQQIATGIGLFREMYEATMTRLHSRPFYHFPNEYYQTMVEQMGPFTMLAFARQGDEPVAAGLFFKDLNFAHYHLSATTAKGLELRGTTLLLHEAALWARDEGCSWLHLGGGIRPYDGLHHFKASFGAYEFPYNYVTVIADQEKYQRLASEQNPLWPYSERHKDSLALVHSKRG